MHDPWETLFLMPGNALLHRTVRMEACMIMGILAPKAGRSLVKALKSLLGPWCLAQADSHSDTARNAGAAFRETFPGPKAREAVALFRIQVGRMSCGCQVIIQQDYLCQPLRSSSMARWSSQGLERPRKE